MQNTSLRSEAPVKYHFHYVASCNMCSSESAQHRVLGKRLNQSQGKNPDAKIGLTTTVLRCRNCGLVYPNPLPVPENFQDHYGVEPEEYWKEEYFNGEASYFQAEIKRLKTLMHIQPGMCSLDIGAGLGKAMNALSREGFDAYGCEASKQFYERAISNMGIKPSHLKLGMIEDVNYEQNQFDFISFGAVLEHVYDPAGSLQKALYWLKPNGILHIEVPSSDWLMHKLARVYYRLKGTDYVTNISPMHPPYHLYEFTLRSFEENARQLGYSIAKYEYYVCQTYMPKLADYFLKPYMKWTDTGMQLCVWLRKK